MIIIKRDNDFTKILRYIYILFIIFKYLLLVLL